MRPRIKVTTPYPELNARLEQKFEEWVNSGACPMSYENERPELAEVRTRLGRPLTQAEVFEYDVRKSRDGEVFMRIRERTLEFIDPEGAIHRIESPGRTELQG